MVTGLINILNAAQRDQLDAIQDTSTTIDRVQARLSSGLEVNSALDDPDNFFTSQGLSNRAQDLNRRLDAIGQSLRTIQVAEDGAQGALEIIDLAEAHLLDVEKRLKSGEIGLDGLANVTQIRPENPDAFESYGGSSQDRGGTINVRDDGREFSFTGNLWKKIRIDYTITPDTVLEFEFRSTEIPEFGSIGFDNDDVFANDSNRFFLYGTQTAAGRYTAPIATYRYDGSGEFVSYEIPVGTFFTGTFTHMNFINDDDVNPTGSTEYRNVFLREGTIEQNSDTLSQLEQQYSTILDQLDALVKDASYRGINLLDQEDLITFFNEDGSSFLLSEGINATSLGLGLNRVELADADNVREQIGIVNDARETLRRYLGTLAQDFGVIRTREIFTNELINTLESGSDDLTLDDQNESGAELLALQTRQQLQFNTLASPQASILELL